MKKIILITWLIVVTTACTSTGRYSMRHDTGPTRYPTTEELVDAEPKFEPPRERGNANYQVRGKYYQPMKTSKGFSQRGEASWYGKKFHGHLTSNGEIYDMFAMSAAHKTLPIPCYARVTNLANNKQVIVRINDRGPFHGDRIIDLSYSAATKLDMLKTGTANVQLDVIHVDENGAWILPENAILPFEENQDQQLLAREVPENSDDKLFIQVAAMSDSTKLDEMARGFSLLYQVQTRTAQVDNIFKLQLGPLIDEEHALELLETLKSRGYEQAFKLYTR